MSYIIGVYNNEEYIWGMTMVIYKKGQSNYI